MSDRLTAYLRGDRVGWFTDVGGGVQFEFDDEWRQGARRMELSLSLPKSRRTHRGDAPITFLWNLLPDNATVLERWGARFSVSPRNPMALLAHVGLDTAGAVQLAETDAPVLEGPEALEPIEVAEIATHLRELRSDPEAWFLPGHAGGFFSLAGAQSKFALAATDAGWAVPTGRAASTHIVKPGIRGLPHSDLNEHLSLAAASLLGLRAAVSRIERFEDETAIVVERYDRLRHGVDVERLHQEDLAQATATHPARKYQNEGGPGIRGIVDVLRETRGRDVDDSVRRFVEATIFNWAILGTDAHAKNYSILHDGRRGPGLAPLYDVATVLPYDDLNTRRARLSMSFGRHYRVAEIEPRHIAQEAIDAGLDADWAIATAKRIVGGVADAYADAGVAAPLAEADAAFAARITSRVGERAEQLARELDRPLRIAATQRRDGGAAQPRNRDIGGPGNPGSFASPSAGK